MLTSAILPSASSRTKKIPLTAASLAAEDLQIGVVGRQSVDGLYGFHGDLAAGDWVIPERAVQHHVLGEQTGEDVFVCAAVDAVDEGLQGVAVRGECGHGYS
jgi:hypothetical protein